MTRTKPNLSVVLAVVTAVAILLPPTPLAQLVGGVGTVTCVGALALSWRRAGDVPMAQRLAIGIGAGFLGFLMVGALLGSVLSLVGVTRPLSRLPLSVCWVVLLSGLAAFEGRRGTDPVRASLEGVTRRHAVWLLVLSVPPMLALWGAVTLDTSGSASLAIVTATLVVVMALLAIAKPIRRLAVPRAMLLVSAFVTAALQGPLRGGWLAGVDTQHEFYIGSVAIREAAFPLTHFLDPYGGMLSLTVLPTELNSLFGLNLRTTMVLLPSLFLGCCMLAVWSTLRERCAASLAAFLSCVFVVGSIPLLQELPVITRQCYALFFFTLIVLGLTSKSMRPSQARFAVVIGGIGVAVTHYSTAYLAAGAVICGYLLSLAVREARERRVLTLPVTVAVAGFAVAWGGLVARTGSSIGQVLSAIRADGFDFLPGSGGLISRWLNAASINRLVSAGVIRAQDLTLLRHSYRWMTVSPSAFNVHLVNDPAPTAGGVPAVGSLLSVSSTLVAELTLLLAAVVVVVTVFLAVTKRRKELASLAGFALFLAVFAAVSRFSQTLGVDFAPSRVQAQAYLAFVVVVGVVLEGHPVLGWLRARAASQRRVLLACGLVIAGLAVATSTELVNLAERGAQLPSNLSMTGEQAQRLISPEDVEVAAWLKANRPAPLLVQADRFGQLALDIEGYNDRRDFVSSVDPVIVAIHSWVFAYHTNLAGSARGGNNAEVGVFKFPLRFYTSTRSILYVTSTDAVFGDVPYDGP